MTIHIYTVEEEIAEPPCMEEATADQALWCWYYAGPDI